MTDTIFDVAIIGAGVVGCAIARELSKYKLQCALIEANNDVGAGTSKANTAILHTGFDAKPGYLETRLLRRGYELLKAYCPEAGIPIEQVGALLVAWDEEQLDALPAMRDLAHQNGIADVEIMSATEAYRREPHLGKGALGALVVPGEAIICPFTTPLAFATQAVINGLSLQLNSAVQAVEVSSKHTYAIRSTNRTAYARFVVNAAGLHADSINRQFDLHNLTIIPRRGELIVYDKLSRPLVNHILLPVPGKMGKGVLIAPTVFGNVMLGPTAENVDDKTATNTTIEGIAALLDKGRRILPELVDEEVTAMYAGLRTSTSHDDYQIHIYPEKRYICVGGIRSTGLSASMGIAEFVVEQLAKAGLDLAPKVEFKPVRMPNIGEAFMRPYQSEDMIAANPDYGRIVCHCERVTRAEIQAATYSLIPVHDYDGLRRRTRALMGRCQGFFCSAGIAALLARSSEQNSKQVAGTEP
jgi:glycerol-3-phosphate dehydrogenase